MSSDILHLNRVKDFVATMKSKRMLSTGATVVHYSGVLYNVQGSTHDPKEVPGHEGLSWKSLLKINGIEGNCYVSEPRGEGSHPDFSVGGHMTPNQDGSVSNGITFLMPLCYWHNSTSRDGIPFTLSENKMLRLTGYNLGELEATFKMRLPNSKPYSVLYYNNDHWDFLDVSEEEALRIKNNGFDNYYYVLMKRHEERSLDESGNKSKFLKERTIIHKPISLNLPS